MVEELTVSGVRLISPRVFEDERGYFFESYSAERYEAMGVPARFVQDNVSFSRRGVLRGLHFQSPGAQGKLVQVLRGEVFDVAVDLRRDSLTFGRWAGATLSDANRRQLWIPAGCAHGFVVTGECALFSYKCTDYYRPGAERTLRWDDPEVGIEWPVPAPALSAKDAAGKSLRELLEVL